MRNSLFTLIILLISLIHINAQSLIKGNVIDHKGESIPGAHITLSLAGYQDMTDLKGNFRIYDVPNGNYELKVTYIGYAPFTSQISLNNEKEYIQNIILVDGNRMQEIIINGRLEGQAKALNVQKNRVNISEIIAAEQIERFPDANLGDALKRLSGINVQYDQGEARFANIRGTAPELNSITINGERVPSAEAEKRFVQLDLIPSDMVGTVEVSKAVTPDMDGDAIGGSINLVTQKAESGSKLRGTIGTGYSFLPEKPLYKGMLSYSNRFANNKLGIIVNASALDKQVRSDNIEGEWNYSDENNKNGSAQLTDFQIRQYELERLRQSYATTIDYAFNSNHNIYFSGMYTKREDWENRYRLRFKDIKTTDEGFEAEIRRETKGGSNNKFARLEDQRTYSIGGGGEHYIEKLKIKWSVTSLLANEDRPNERYISLRAKKQPLSIDYADLRYPKLSVTNSETNDLSNAYSVHSLTEEFQFTEEKDFNTRLDLELPLISGNNASYIKIGGRYKMKNKIRQNTFSEYEAEDEEVFQVDALNNTVNKTFENFSHDGYTAGSFINEEFLGNTNLNNGFDGQVVLEELAGNFDAEENVAAGYIMYTQQLGNKLSIIAGTRIEHTSVKYEGQIFDGETLTSTKNQADSYTNILPGIHVRYSPSEWSNIKAAWTNTIARPNYFDLVPFQQINADDNQIKIGNPGLEATTSTNYDLLGEYYFRNLGIVSGGIFYKKLTNVIADKTQNDFEFQGNIYDRFEQPVNAGNANLFGFELGLQRRLDFLPSVLSKLTLYANYTYTKSELNNISLEGRSNETLPLAGTPKNLYNLSLAYDSKTFDLRVSYNYAGAFIEEYNDESFFDRWYGSVNYLDINADMKIADHWTLYVSANNLLDQPLRYYQGIEERIMQEEYYGIHTKIGLKFRY